jgi:glucose-fructose oxidoreductase
MKEDGEKRKTEGCGMKKMPDSADWLPGVTHPGQMHHLLGILESRIQDFDQIPLPCPSMNTPSPREISRRKFIRNASLATAATWTLGGRSWAADASPPAAAPAPVKKLGVALAGLGGYSTGQLRPALQETQFCQLMGVVTRRPEVGAQWAQASGFPEKNIYNYDTMDQLAGNPDIDIVYVVTPNGLHAEHVIKAAKAGKHVICEKPMANTVAECDAMLAACREAKRTLSIGYRLHFDPYHQKMVQLAADPNFGPFTKMAGENGFTLNGDQWRIHHPLSGGGPLMDMGIYVVHAACMAANANPLAVTATEHAKTKPDVFVDVEEALDWTMEFPGGAVATCQTSYVKNFGHFHAEGAKGWIDFPSAFGYSGIRMNTSNGPVTFPPLRQQAAHMDGIAQAIMAKKDSPVPGELGRRDMVIIEGIYQAAASGKRVELKYA